MLQVGTRACLMYVPSYAKDDLYKMGTVKTLYYSVSGELTADVLLDGDSGASVCYAWQLQEVDDVS